MSEPHAVARLAFEMRRALDELPAAYREPGPFPDRPSGGEVVLIPAPLAAAVHRACHYLGSPRSEGLHVALLLEGRPAAMFSFTPSDLDHLDSVLGPGPAVVLSRHLVFPGAPRSCTSFGLSRARSLIMKEWPRARFLLTYVNLELGFSGTSYKASGWRLVAFERKTRSVLLDGMPITNRELVRRFGTADRSVLRQRLADRIGLGPTPLAPLAVFAKPLRGTLPTPGQDVPVLEPPTAVFGTSEV